MRGKILCGASVACLLFRVSSANATLIISDSFPTGDYVAGESLYNNGSSQGPTELGFSGTWNHGTQTNNFVSTATENDNAALGSTPAGDVQWAGASNSSAQDRIAARNINTITTPSVYYTSTLLEEDGADAAPTAGDFVGMGYANATNPVLGTTTATQTGFYVGFAEESATDPGSLVIRTRTTTAIADADTILVNGTNTATPVASQLFLVVTETDVNYSGSLDQIRWWVNPTDLTSDTTMSNTATYTGQFNSYADQGNSSDLTRLNLASPVAFAPEVEFDETRLATTSADLYIAPVPEPASLGLIGIAAGSMLRRRRR
jgi:hypothetical protein